VIEPLADQLPLWSCIKLHSVCAIIAIVSIVSLRFEVEHSDFNESIHTACT